MEAIFLLAEQIREHYLKGYLTCLADFQAEHSPSAPEILLELSPESGFILKLYRIDMGANSGGSFKTKEVNLETHLKFQPFRERMKSGLEVTFLPIAWNGVEFLANATASTEPLEQWALKWLDVDDKHMDDEHGLQGVIHSVTKPEPKDSALGISVDFGSAPVTAFSELLDVLQGMGATSIEISSSCLG